MGQVIASDGQKKSCGGTSIDNLATLFSAADTNHTLYHATASPAGGGNRPTQSRVLELKQEGAATV